MGAIKKPRRALARKASAALALVVAATWAPRASASASFPAQVDTDLNLPSMWVEKSVAPPDGCLLCHKIEIGGLNTNNGFGAEMKRNGAMATLPKTLAGAFQAIEASDPLAISDIKMGVNPNDDPKWLSGSTTTDPVPTYGCGSVSRGRPNRVGVVALLGSLLALFVARVASRRRRAARAGAP
jgi:hypothetical protein